MNDRELLELAAKAAGYQHRFDDGTHYIKGQTLWLIWNPHDDDGDALRLAVKLRFFVEIYDTFSDVRWADGGKRENHGHNSYAATRRAIVRAAAEIGKRVK